MRVLLPLLILCAACNTATTTSPPASSGTSRAAPEGGSASTPLVVASWNLEWFGSTMEGPTDEEAQFANVTTVMRAMDADLWSVQEVVDPAALERLGPELGNYSTLVSNDPSVISGSSVYKSENGLKLGIVYRPERLEVRAARVVLESNLDPFNGRAPMEVDLATKPGGTALTLIVVHLSPGTDAASYEKRKTAAALLKAHLDAKPEGSLVMVAGDFNDGLEKSSFQGSQTPFAPFLEDPAYAFVTLGLQSPRYPRVIDHQLVTDDLAGAVTAGTPRVIDGDTLVEGFVTNTSDHDPVIARYELP